MENQANDLLAVNNYLIFLLHVYQKKEPSASTSGALEVLHLVAIEVERLLCTEEALEDGE